MDFDWTFRMLLDDERHAFRFRFENPDARKDARQRLLEFVKYAASQSCSDELLDA